MSTTRPAAKAVDPHLAVVIDDDNRLGEFIAAPLKELGMRVAIYQIAKDALAALEDGHPAIIFLDVALLRSDAIDVLHGLRERCYGGVVQLMSGGRQALLEAVQRIGIRDGVTLMPPLNKPFVREAIVRIIEDLRRMKKFTAPDRVLAGSTGGR